MKEKKNHTFLLKDCKLTTFLSPYIEFRLLDFQNSNFSSQGTSLFLQDQLVATLGPSLNGQDVDGSFFLQKALNTPPFFQ